MLNSPYLLLIIAVVLFLGLLIIFCACWRVRKAYLNESGAQKLDPEIQEVVMETMRKHPNCTEFELVVTRCPGGLNRTRIQEDSGWGMYV